jgi:hypothetical protein
VAQRVEQCVLGLKVAGSSPSKLTLSFSRLAVDKFSTARVSSMWVTHCGWLPYCVTWVIHAPRSPESCLGGWLGRRYAKPQNLLIIHLLFNYLFIYFMYLFFYFFMYLLFIYLFYILIFYFLCIYYLFIYLFIYSFIHSFMYFDLWCSVCCLTAWGLGAWRTLQGRWWRSRQWTLTCGKLQKMRANPRPSGPSPLLQVRNIIYF